MKFLVLFCFIALAITQGSTQLICYECDDCGEITDDTPQATCGTVVTEPPATEPPTEPPATEPPTTEPPTTEPPTTERPATEPPATEPPTTEPPITETPATEPPATEPPITETPATEPPATEPPTTETPATEPPTTETPETEPPATDAPATDAPEIPEVDLPTVLKQLYNHRQSRSLRQDETTYQCYSFNYQDGETTKTRRGCAVAQETAAEVCDAVEEENESCEVCTENLCNFANNLTVSMFLLLGAVVLALKF